MSALTGRRDDGERWSVTCPGWPVSWLMSTCIAESKHSMSCLLAWLWSGNHGDAPQAQLQGEGAADIQDQEILQRLNGLGYQNILYTDVCIFMSYTTSLFSGRDEEMGQKREFGWVSIAAQLCSSCAPTVFPLCSWVSPDAVRYKFWQRLTNA